MATYPLTSDDDTFDGTGDADTFDGAVTGATGGTDTLTGGGGADLFQLGDGSAGTIDGGSGTDTVALYGAGLGGTVFTTVETLDLLNGSVYATTTQLSAFTSIVNSSNPGSELTFYLTEGGTLDLSTRLSLGYTANISGSGSSSALAVTGSGATTRSTARISAIR